MGVERGDGICRLVRSGSDPPVLAPPICKLGPVACMCSGDGYIIPGTSHDFGLDGLRTFLISFDGNVFSFGFTSALITLS